jgi:hypothetical protein
MDLNFTTNSSFTTWKGSPPADAMSGTDASGSLDIDARPAPRLVGVADAVPPSRARLRGSQLATTPGGCL